MRKLEKPFLEGINSAFCQNAFDAAVVQVSGRLNNINDWIFCQKVWDVAQSKMYCLLCRSGISSKKMEENITTGEGTFYEDCKHFARKCLKRIF